MHPKEYREELHYHPFAVNLDRCVGSCKTLDDLSNRVCIPNKMEDLNVRVFNTITGINESKLLTKQILCKCECKFDGRKLTQVKSGITVSVDVSVKILEKLIYARKVKFGILLHVVAKMLNI